MIRSASSRVIPLMSRISSIGGDAVDQRQQEPGPVIEGEPGDLVGRHRHDGDLVHRTDSRRVHLREHLAAALRVALRVLVVGRSVEDALGDDERPGEVADRVAVLHVRDRRRWRAGALGGRRAQRGSNLLAFRGDLERVHQIQR